MTERREFAVGLFIGGLIGLAFGLLFAPQAGSETRDRLRRESERLRERARMKADDVASQARRAAGDAMARGQSAFEDRAERLRRAFDTGREEPNRFGEPEN